MRTEVLIELVDLSAAQVAHECAAVAFAHAGQRFFHHACDAHSCGGASLGQRLQQVLDRGAVGPLNGQHSSQRSQSEALQQVSALCEAVDGVGHAAWPLPGLALVQDGSFRHIIKNIA